MQKSVSIAVFSQSEHIHATSWTEKKHIGGSEGAFEIPDPQVLVDHGIRINRVRTRDHCL